ncbi:DUF222 domain-containing protein [Arthrobacter sp. ISL-65]|uniref:DUF222 domain-containing protein n=1 Tax=Arthrobacter sp. ISL-65 TaxID=2819112 RepID=UPI0027DEDD77|nr:DUF222 domain-containing protein [Arthrobacter sp. ISL-65]
MTGGAVAEAVEAIGASASALAVLARRGTAGPALSGAESGGDQTDPLQERTDAWLDALAEVATLEARVAALKVQLAAELAATDTAMAPPAESPPDRVVRQMSLTAEVAGALTVSEGSAARFLEESARLSTDLPLTLAALGSGTISWQHGRIMCDETDGLEPERPRLLRCISWTRTRQGLPGVARPGS